MPTLSKVMKMTDAGRIEEGLVTYHFRKHSFYIRRVEANERYIPDEGVVTSRYWVVKNFYTGLDKPRHLVDCRMSIHFGVALLKLRDMMVAAFNL